MKKLNGIKLVTHYPKGGYVIALIISFMVSCGTIKTNHVNKPVEPALFLPVVEYASTDNNTSDTAKKTSAANISYQTTTLQPELKKVTETVQNTGENVDTLKRTIANLTKALVNRDKSDEVISNLTVTVTRYIRKTDSLSMGWKMEKEMRKKEKLVAENQHNIDNNITKFFNYYLPLVVAFVLIAIGFFMGYQTRKTQSANSFKII